MSEQKILATVDGVNITEADVDAYIAKLPQEQQAYAAYPQFKEHCLKQLMAFHLYAKMAVEEKMDETEEFKAQMEKARKEILAQTAINSVLKDIVVTEEELQAFYKSLGQFRCRESQLERARVKILYINEDYFMYERINGNDKMLFAISNSFEPKSIVVPDEYKSAEKVYSLKRSNSALLTPYGGVALKLNNNN